MAVCFQIRERGFIREGYHADLVMVDLNGTSDVHARNILYKCGWSPLEGMQFPASVINTFVNGHLVYGNGRFDESQNGKTFGISTISSYSFTMQIDNTTYADLSVFQTTDEYSIFSKLDRTRTVGGRMQLLEFFNHPFSQLDKILQTQEILRIILQIRK